ncbi:hypothetical protein N0V94_006735 [Neodidymelliopsis sp. IMI 364377]|nr:hypothetical protein N0V94_006735 [Neodidymelliopsis sp. IMI 364377]
MGAGIKLSGASTLPPPNIETYQLIHGLQPLSKDFRRSIGIAAIGRYEKDPRLNPCELIYGVAYDAPPVARQAIYIDSGFQTASYDVSKIALARAKAKASMTVSKYRTAASQAGYDILAEIKDKSIVHSEQYPFKGRFDSDGNLLNGTEDVSTQDLYELPNTDHDDGENNTDSDTLSSCLPSDLQTAPKTQNDIEMTTDTFFDVMSFPDDASCTEEYLNAPFQDSASKLHQEGTEEQCQSETEISSEDWIAGNKDKGKGRMEGYTPDNPYSTWDSVELELGHYVLTKPGNRCVHFDPSSDSDLEDPLDLVPESPTPLHLDAASQLPQSELVNHINDFLKQNVSKLEVFRTRKQRYSTVGTRDPVSIETELSPAWDNALEIAAITTGVLWLDALLLPFQRSVFVEDEINLRPQLEQAARDLYAIGDMSITERSGEKIRKSYSD